MPDTRQMALAMADRTGEHSEIVTAIVTGLVYIGDQIGTLGEDALSLAFRQMVPTIRGEAVHLMETLRLGGPAVPKIIDETLEMAQRIVEANGGMTDGRSSD